MYIRIYTYIYVLSFYRNNNHHVINFLVSIVHRAKEKFLFSSMVSCINVTL